MNSHFSYSIIFYLFPQHSLFVSRSSIFVSRSSALPHPASKPAGPSRRIKPQQSKTSLSSHGDSPLAPLHFGLSTPPLFIWLGPPLPSCNTKTKHQRPIHNRTTHRISFSFLSFFRHGAAPLFKPVCVCNKPCETHLSLPSPFSLVLSFCMEHAYMSPFSFSPFFLLERPHYSSLRVLNQRDTSNGIPVGPFPFPGGEVVDAGPRARGSKVEGGS